MGRGRGGFGAFRNLKPSDVVNGKIKVGVLQETKESREHNIRCEFDGLKFDSKLERDYYKNNLQPRFNRGEVKWFLRQVPFACSGGRDGVRPIVYRCDFLEFWKDGSVHIVDVKGRRTEMYKLKKKLVESLYPIRIEEKFGR